MRRTRPLWGLNEERWWYGMLLGDLKGAQASILWAQKLAATQEYGSRSGKRGFIVWPGAEVGSGPRGAKVSSWGELLHAAAVTTGGERS